MGCKKVLVWGLAGWLAPGVGCFAGAAQTPAAGAQAGQTARARLEFEIASVKQNKSDDLESQNIPLGPGDVYVATGGLLSARAVPLITYILFAYKITNSQAQDLRRQLPDWVSSERFDIQARSEKPNPTKDEMRLMMRSLLADRFTLAVHTESKQVMAFGLVLVKPGQTGPKLRQRPANDLCSNDASAAMNPGPGPAPPETVEGGFPAICGGVLLVPSTGSGSLHFGARNVTMAAIASAMPSWGDLGRPVVDQTGLTGKFDFAMEFTPESQAAAGEPGMTATAPTFLQALKEQLGLKLESQKAAIEVFVVDHVEHPTAN